MKFISHYKEFDRREKDSVLNNISNTPIKGKEKLLEYMKTGTDGGVCCSAVYDFVEGFSTGKTIHCYTDGEYFWNDKEIYHFEHYNLKLDENFIEKVLSI